MAPLYFTTRTHFSLFDVAGNLMAEFERDMPSILLFSHLFRTFLYRCMSTQLKTPSDACMPFASSTRSRSFVSWMLHAAAQNEVSSYRNTHFYIFLLKVLGWCILASPGVLIHREEVWCSDSRTRHTPHTYTPVRSRSPGLTSSCSRLGRWTQFDYTERQTE